ncbi:Similar to hypothetical protein FOXB_12371 [Fusarium oxysporum Fo5176]; acc. no. EGU77120 [Pyronema omphalodes CBS 100304]|uniref:Ubiquitin-like domain-containing protein n=1 Tax=Pyronema omphalodes (strain CBS 100304) TaxID=1076935 RepID=U4KX48_PYROM|nr:Similar to hypothetical protein FOXB_12371 [Fusarium oxysporum Fo5176]; acc. no. EGU77120 [Pyronema omphalodes CBS 100304]
MTVRTQQAVNDTMEVTTRTYEKVEPNLEVSRNNGVMLREIHEIMGSLSINMINLPKNMGYAWPGSSGPTENVIHFEDATGKVVQLPMDLCKDFESLCDVTEIMFRNRPGYKEIVAGMFAVQNSQDGTILPYTYHDQIFPGIKLSVKIVKGTVRTSNPAEFVGRKCGYYNHTTLILIFDEYPMTFFCRHCNGINHGLRNAISISQAARYNICYSSSWLKLCILLQRKKRTRFLSASYVFTVTLGFHCAQHGHQKTMIEEEDFDYIIY